MTREEMLQKMQDAATVGGSKLSMRSENAQKVRKANRIGRLKKALKKKSKLLIFAELALPFNPETGTEDENFNSDIKFRPTFSATTTALMLKAKADENEVLKAALMRRAGITEWDTKSEEFTKEDWKVFAKYRVPRVFSLPVVHVNIPALTKNEFGRDYEVHVEYDESGEIVGEVPGVLKIDKLFRDKFYEEFQEYKKEVDAGRCKDTDEQQKKARQKIYDRNPVSSVRPANNVLVMELPLTSKYELSGEFDLTDFDAKKVAANVVLQKYGGDFYTAMQKYIDGSYEAFDKYFDFFVLDMACPAEGDPNTKEGKMKIGKDTTFERSVCDVDGAQVLGDNYQTVLQAIREYEDNTEDIEEIVRRSLYTPVYTEDVESQLYQALPTVLDIEHDKYVTNKVLKENSEVITIAFGGLGMSMLDAIDCGVSDKEEGSLDKDGSAQEAKTYDLDSEDFVDDSESPELEEVEMA